MVAGLRGDFNTDWNYEISANYGEHKENNVITGNVNTQRFLLALDTTKNSQGQIVCRSQVNAAPMPAATSPAMPHSSPRMLLPAFRSTRSVRAASSDAARAYLTGADHRDRQGDPVRCERLRLG